MKCPNCNAENNEGAKFCKKCGTPLEKKANSHEKMINSMNNEKKSDNTKIIIAALIIIAVVLAGAFEDLPADSEIHYTKNGATTAYNPFALTAFDATATIATPRNIVLVVTDATLAGKYADGANGLGSGNAWDIFRVIYEAAPVVSATLDLYRNNNEATVAWARNPIIPAVPANFVSIQRVQDIENEGDVKLTLYQTYTDEEPVG